VSTQYLSLPDGQIAYDDTGSGPLVICLPSIGDLRSEYRLLVPQLVAAGYRVVTVDPRGQGESSVRWPDYSVVGEGADLLALTRALDAGPAVVIGTSMAAGAAVWAAAEAPEQFSGLLLVSPILRDMQPRWQSRLMYMLLFAPLFSGSWGASLWARYLTLLYPSAQPADFNAYLRRLRANLREPGHMAALRAMLYASKRASDERLEQATAPALIVVGTKDMDFHDPAAEARVIASRLGGKDHQVEVIAGAGHYPHAEAPERFTPLAIDFLRRIAPTHLGARDVAG